MRLNHNPGDSPTSISNLSQRVALRLASSGFGGLRLRLAQPAADGRQVWTGLRQSIPSSM
jgi:hypothetical protein